jgi:hypothetical protein
MIGNFAAASDVDIARLRAEPNAIRDFLYQEERQAIDVNKAWQAIHFLLVGEPYGGALPLGFILGDCGAVIGDVDVGYGPARAFVSDEVRAIAHALRELDGAALMARWNAEAVRGADIYGVDPDNVAEEAQYVSGHFDALKGFLEKLAAEGSGLIVYLN